MDFLKYGKLEINPAHLHETVNIQLMQKGTSLREGYGADDTFIMPRIEAIHAGRTRNFNHYPAEKLRGDASIGSGVYSWMQPYAKPVIYNHDTSTEATGRIVSAAYAEYTQAGRPGIILIPKITEPKAIKAVQDKRLLTVSIGASTDAAICSICGTDIINEGYCGHMKGEEYEGRTAEWISGNIWFDELSWVNVPADSDAMVVDTQAGMYLDTTSEADWHSSGKMHEFFGVPRRTELLVIESAPKADKAKNLKQEESNEMENEPETIVSEETETETTSVEEPEVTATEPEDETAAPDEADAPAEENDAEEAEGETEVPEVKAEESLLDAINQSLMEQVAALTQELRGLYVERIVEKSAIAAEKKEAFVEKLNKRSIESLKDKLEDMADMPAPTQVVETAVEKPVRTVTKVSSPVPVKESAEIVFGDKEKINFFSSLIKGK